MSYIKVDGYDAKGNKRSINYVNNYVNFGRNCYAAFAAAIDWAKEEYICDYIETDEGYKPTGNSYREFERIVSIQLFDEEG